MFWPHDWSPKLHAAALATEHWRDGEWSRLMVKKDSGYDQFGACHGEVKIYGNDLAAYADGMVPEPKSFEVHLPSLRQRRFGSYKSHNVHRSGVIIGNIEDGVAFEIGAMSGKYGLTQ
jgi:hypothetical protein